ncbi:GDSL-like Lipase/Acylhydrolase [Dactylonectria estremocensis]|uniref:GDSL-like Lipase/Acylhydrolase n=1 Tax=Dactylonectria estremocensis TaxID=1079267 RepID=A0A9P9E6S7_9HYPO|nr:GDSL-like Lipase/Acylhydrolase [Dactylonectria estremocensis]
MPFEGEARANKPPAFILAGDSTTAVQSAGGGGWGNGFLSFLRNSAWGVNLGHNGATTVSFVSGGDWNNVKQYVTDNVDSFEVYVTIQFGHNDQKTKYNISLDEYQANLQNLATEVRDLGGHPILVTPLTRRNFESDHNATDSLHNERLYTIAAASKSHTKYLDLNKKSLWYVNSIGEEASHVYNLNPDDNTHLNDYGSVVFGRMVADLLLKREPRLAHWISPNNTLSVALAQGVPA